jgi:hypothetical protein
MLCKNHNVGRNSPAGPSQFSRCRLHAQGGLRPRPKSPWPRETQKAQKGRSRDGPFRRLSLASFSARRATVGFCRSGAPECAGTALGGRRGIGSLASSLGTLPPGDSSCPRPPGGPRPSPTRSGAAGEGDEEFLSTATIVVSNGLLHEQMLCVSREGDAGATA